MQRFQCVSAAFRMFRAFARMREARASAHICEAPEIAGTLERAAKSLRNND